MVASASPSPEPAEHVVIAARLRRSADIALARTVGLARGDRLFSLRARPNEQGIIRLAVSSGRAVGGAVLRNRVRRRLREAVRVDLRTRSQMPALDLALVARATLSTAKAATLRGSVARVLDQVAQAAHETRPAMKQGRP